MALHVEEGGNRRLLTGSGERDAEVCDGEQLRRVDAVSSQQLHKIPRFYTSGHRPLRKSTLLACDAFYLHTIIQMKYMNVVLIMLLEQF